MLVRPHPLELERTLDEGVGLGCHGEPAVERVDLSDVDQFVLQQATENVERL